jgi:hypothetical protein
MEHDQWAVRVDAFHDAGQGVDDVAAVHGGWIGCHAGGRQCPTQAIEARQVVGPQAGQQPVGAVFGGGVDREGVDPRPACDGREVQCGQVAQLSPDGAVEADQRAVAAGGEGGTVRP